MHVETRVSTESSRSNTHEAQARLDLGMRLISSSKLPSDGIAEYELRQRHARGELTRVHRGTYLDSELSVLAANSAEVTHASRVFGFMRRSETATVSGISAAVLHGLPLLNHRLTGPITVTRRNHGARRAHVAVRRSHLRAEDVTTLHGLPVTTLKRTIQDLAENVELPELLAATEAALRQGGDITGLEAPLRHRRALRWVSMHASARSESYAESWSKYVLYQHGFSFDWQQVSVFDERGRFVARCDFGSELGLLGEFDGRIKYGEIAGSTEAAADAIMAEKERENRLRSLGWDVARWTWADLHDADRLIRRLNAQLANAAAAPRPRGSIRIEPLKRAQPPNWSAIFGLH